MIESSLYPRTIKQEDASTIYQAYSLAPKVILSSNKRKNREIDWKLSKTSRTIQLAKPSRFIAGVLREVNHFIKRQS